MSLAYEKEILSNLTWFKRKALEYGAQSAAYIDNPDFFPLENTRGLPAYGIRLGNQFVVGHADEGLGTKPEVAYTLYKHQKHLWQGVAFDAVAMAVNDLLSLGILPASISMHITAGSDTWLADKERAKYLLSGWRDAAKACRAVWSCGQTSIEEGVIYPDKAIMSSSVWGVRKGVYCITPACLVPGDSIVFVGSSGIHANGLTRARRLANVLEFGFDFSYSGSSYGELLLTPTYLYVDIMRDCIEEGIDIHFASPITGGGWRKIMRAPQSYQYTINHVPEPGLVFKIIQEQGKIPIEQMYEVFNMGVGYVLFLPPTEAQRLIQLALRKQYPYSVYEAGIVEESPTRRVFIKPLDLRYKATE